MLHFVQDVVALTHRSWAEAYGPTGIERTGIARNSVFDIHGNRAKGDLQKRKGIATLSTIGR